MDVFTTPVSRTGAVKRSRAQMEDEDARRKHQDMVRDQGHAIISHLIANSHVRRFVVKNDEVMRDLDRKLRARLHHLGRCLVLVTMRDGKPKAYSAKTVSETIRIFLQAGETVENIHMSSLYLSPQGSVPLDTYAD